MLVSNKNYKSIWCEGSSIKIIDQTLLPFNFKIIELKTSDDFVDAIVSMKVGCSFDWCNCTIWSC